MARGRPKGSTNKPKDGGGEAPGIGDNSTPGGACPDEVKRDAYREALILKIAVESAAEVAKSKLGAYRAYLKAAAKKGVDTEAIADALADRFKDPDVVLIKLREKIKMLDLSGLLPGIREQLLGRLDIIEPTSAEEEESQVLIAFDRGHASGRKGESRDVNPYDAGTLGHVKWHDGWVAGQRAIADEMAPAASPVASAPKPTRQGKFTPNTPAEVAGAIANDDGELPGQPAALVH